MNQQMHEAFENAVNEHTRLLENFKSSSADTVFKIAGAIIDAVEAGGRIYICGNGGSAADAQHIAAELIGRFRRQRPALPAVALTTDTSTLTSVANDYGFDQVFLRQVEALLGPKDIFWAISTSGTSPNVIAAAELAQKRKAGIIAFTGKADSRLQSMAQLCFCPQSPLTAASQEMHVLAYHIICDIVEQHFAEKSEVKQ